MLHLDQPDSAELSETEKGALRYITGYICRQLHKRLEKETHEFKEEMILCLMEMTKNNDEDQMHGVDEEWTELIDMGGFWRVKESTYQFFCAVEYAIREALKNY